jgi:arabinofuranosyltransferase
VQAPARSGRTGPRERGRLPVASPFLLPAVLVPLIALFFLRAERNIAGDWGYCLDDSWIHATFARNLATGHGYSFNPGETVGGSTGPLYTLILAFFYWAFREVIWSAKIFGILCQIGAALAIYSAVLALLPNRSILALIAALFVASAPPLAWAMLSGMEISLYLLLVCVGLNFYVRSRPLAAVAFWSLGVWARSDGLFLVLLGTIAPPREMVRRLAVAAPLVLLFFGFNETVGGHLLPQTVTTKAHLGFDVLGRSWNILRETGELWGVPYRHKTAFDEPIVLLPFVLLGTWLAIRKAPLLSLYTWGFPLAISLFHGHTAPEKRYVLYVIPFGVALAALAWNQIDAWMADRWRSVGITSAGVCLAMQALILPARAERYGWNVQNINKMQITLAKFAGLVTQPGDAVAVNDIGAMGYFSGRYVVDLVGLVTPPRSLPEDLTLYRPKLLVIFVRWFRPYARDDPKTGNFLFFDSDSTHRYELLAGIDLRRNTICAASRMTAYVRLGKNDPSPTQRWLYVF